MSDFMCRGGPSRAQCRRGRGCCSGCGRGRPCRARRQSGRGTSAARSTPECGAPRPRRCLRHESSIKKFSALSAKIFCPLVHVEQDTLSEGREGEGQRGIGAPCTNDHQPTGFALALPQVPFCQPAESMHQEMKSHIFLDLRLFEEVQKRKLRRNMLGKGIKQ